MNMSKISVMILLLGMIIAVVVGVVIIIAYKRKVNKALREEQSSAHMRIPAPADTMSIVVKVVVIALLIWIAFALRNINELKEDIANMQSNISGQLMSLAADINNLKEELAAVNSRVMYYNSEVTSVDTSDDTCMVKHTLKLKSFSDKTTVILRTADGKESSMAKVGEGVYEANVKADLFRIMLDEDSIIIKDGDTSTVETVNRYYGNIYAYSTLVIPELNAMFEGFDTRDNTISIGNIVMFSEQKTLYHISSAKVVMEQNGKEIDTIDATEAVKAGLEREFGEVRIELNKLYNVDNKDSFSVTVYITTSDGYTVKQPVFVRNVNKVNTTFGNRFDILDQNGNVKTNH